MKTWLVIYLSTLIGLAGCNAPTAAAQGLLASVQGNDDSLSHDDSHCTTCEGVRLLNAGDFNRAMRIFLQQDAKGDCTAANNIGWMYEQGLGRPVDPHEAMRWYLKAADQTCPFAAVNAGRLHEQGKGVPVDYGKAMSFYQTAAGEGDAGALYHIGLMFEQGLGSPKEPDAAFAYYSMAARAGDERAEVHMQALIASGKLNPRTIAALAARQASGPLSPARSQP